MPSHDPDRPNPFARRCRHLGILSRGSRKLLWLVTTRATWGQCRMLSAAVPQRARADPVLPRDAGARESRGPAQASRGRVAHGVRGPRLTDNTAMPGRPPQGRPPQGVICRMQPTLAPCPGACRPSACLQVKRRNLAPLALAVAFERHGAGFAEALVATAGAKGDRGQRRPVAPKNAQQRHGPAASHRALIEQGPGDSVHPIWSHYPQSAVPVCLPITSPAAPPPARPSSARRPSLSSCYQLRALTISRSRVFSGPARAGVSALSDLCFRISCYSMVLLNSEPPIANRRRRLLACFVKAWALAARHRQSTGPGPGLRCGSHLRHRGRTAANG